MDKLSKVRWGIVYEDMGNMRIVRILEQEKFFASRFPLTESVQYHLSESDLRNIVNNVIREVMAQRECMTIKPKQHQLCETTINGRTYFRTLPLPPERVLASPSWHKKGTRSHVR